MQLGEEQEILEVTPQHLPFEEEANESIPADTEPVEEPSAVPELVPAERE